MPKVGIEDRKCDVSQADSTKVDEDDVNLPIPPMESVNQVPELNLVLVILQEQVSI